MFEGYDSHLFSMFLLKRLEKLTSYHETEFVYCQKCWKLVETGSDDCNHVEGLGKFYSFPIDEQVLNTCFNRDNWPQRLTDTVIMQVKCRTIFVVVFMALRTIE